MANFGFRWTHPLSSYDRGPGIGFLLPLLPWPRRAYDITRDVFFSGVWCWSFGVTLEPLRIKGASAFGLSCRVSFGWVPIR